MNYLLQNGRIKVGLSSLGAELQSIQKDGVEYLWGGDARFWAERSPVLFPYVGRFTKGQYTLDGKAYEMGIHGFARRMEYRTAGIRDSKIVFELRDTEETYRNYPYHFCLHISYELLEDEIQIGYGVENLSDDTMYFGIGGHPGFCVPLEDGLDFSDYYLVFAGKSQPQRVGHTQACFLSGVDTEFPLENGCILPLRHTMFDQDAIVLRHMSDQVTLKSDKSARSVTVCYPDMPYLGLWHAPGTEAPYLCIEPWTSLPSRQDVVEEFRYKSDLIRLRAGKKYSNRWSIRVK